jgi:hypothetical protein
VLDTRDAASGPALPANAERGIVLSGKCGIPGTARAASLNVTVTQPTAPGNLVVFPTGSSPATSTLNYQAGQTRGNNATVALGTGATVSVRATQASGSVHVILDVNGYFQ